MKRTKRIICLILLLILILSSVSSAFSAELAVPSRIYTEVPDGTPLVNEKGFQLNLTLLRDKKIIVYGEYFNVPNNRFKNGSIPTGDINNNHITTTPWNKATNIGCYYKKDTTYGEYEFHGFDLQGNPHSNKNFPVDEALTRPVDTYRWIYRIWDSGSQYYGKGKISKPSDYNKIAMGLGGLSKYGPKQISDMQDNVKNSLKWEVTNPIGYFNGANSKDMFNFAHVYSMPGRYNNGQVLMHHIGNDGKLWYADFTTTEDADDPMVKEPLKPIASFEDKKESIDKNTIYVRGTINDQEYYKDDVDKSLYYTRQDIKSWDFIFKDQYGNEKEIKGIKNTTTNTDRQIFEFPNKFDETHKIIYAKVRVNYVKKNETISKESDWVQLPFDIDPPLPELEEDPEAPNTFPIDPEIEAPRYMLDTERFKIEDKTDYTNVVGSPEVYINGRELSASAASQFLQGQYLFPLTGYDKLYRYNIRYKNELGIEAEYKDYVLVYTTKPSTQVRVTGTQKENRRLVAINDTSSINSSYLLDRSTMQVLNFDIAGEQIYIDTRTNQQIVFLSKRAETDINIDLQVKCVVDPQYIERYDIPSGYHTSNYYTYNMQVIPDYAPAVVANIWNFVLTRTESISMTFDQISTDGDKISLLNSTYKLYYDTNKDGIAETLIKTGKADEFNGYKADKLGTYKVVFYVEEEFSPTELTIAKFITVADKRFTIVERQFYVENLAPSTQIYIDVPQNYPEVDVIVLNDEGITRELNNDIVSTNVSFRNELIRQSLNPSVQIWDLYTYVYSQLASKVDYSGDNYPPTSVSYSSNGYSGTLTRYSVENNRYKVDEGEYVTTTVKTTRANKEVIGYKEDGSIDWGRTSNPQLPDSITVNGVTCYKVDSQSGNPIETYSTGKDGKRYVSLETIPWTAFYEGEKTEWVAKWVWYNDYTGYYSGTIYKNVKQEFKPVYRDTSNKYIIYFANSSVNNLVDYTTIKNKATAKVIVIGNNAVKNDSRIQKDLFIDNTKSLTDIYNEIVTYISNDNVQERGAVVLLNTVFNLSFADYDLEGDPIQTNGFQIVHNQNYFDNPMGQAINTRTVFAENGYTLTSLPNKFDKTGEFSLYRKIKDLPTDYPDKSELSNNANITLLVHRKPIASCTLDWTFINASGTYKTNWVDTSYDPDLQFKDTEKYEDGKSKKGIRERKLKYRKVGETEWIYEIPNNLAPARYELEYVVKDNFNVWSDPFKLNFELPSIPPAQIQAKLKTELSRFSLAGVPASENLIAYDIWTRYPFDLKLQLALFDGATQVSSTQEILQNTSTGTKTGQDVYWKDIMHNIPVALKGTATNPKDYIMRIRAIDTLVSTRYTDISFNVRVKTPIDLIPQINGRQTDLKITAGKNIEIKATTSKYINNSYNVTENASYPNKTKSGLTVTFFYGTTYAITVTPPVLMNKATPHITSGTTANWSLAKVLPLTVPASPKGVKNYKVRFVATLPSGEVEEKILDFEYVHNTPPVIDEGKIFTDLNVGYIYENDDVNYTLKFRDEDLTALKVNIKLYNVSNLITPIKEYNQTILPNGTSYDPYTLRLIDNIPIGSYKVVATVTDDYDEKATIEIPFVANDLWIKGAVEHTEKWNENRAMYNAKYKDDMDKYTFKLGDSNYLAGIPRPDKVFWSGEAFETSADTTEINIASKVICTKVSVEIVNSDKPADKNYLSWLNNINLKNDKWYLYYTKTEWDNKWGNKKPQKLILRFTAYFNNDWIETDDVEIIIDNQDPFWKLHREW